MKQEKIAAMERTVAADYANIAGMVVLKDGERVYENYFGGCTENSRIHVFSVTKSVVSILLGLCRCCFSTVYAAIILVAYFTQLTTVRFAGLTEKARELLAVQRMQDYIEKNRTEDITLSELAGASLFSPWYSYRLFREYIGLTPTEYIRKYRLTQAARRLRTGKVKVIDVSNIQTVFVQIIRKPERLCIIKRGRKAEDYFPLTQGITMMKNAFIGADTGSMLLPVCVMLGLTALCTALSIRFFRWE